MATSRSGPWVRRRTPDQCRPQRGRRSRREADPERERRPSGPAGGGRHPGAGHPGARPVRCSPRRVRARVHCVAGAVRAAQGPARRAERLLGAGNRFEGASAPAAITSQLAAHVVGTLGPITSEELRTLGSPYDASSVVGRTGLEASRERTLAGTPSTHVDVETAAGTPVRLLESFGGRPGAAVRTSIDLRVQRAAEQALARSAHPNVSMVAIRASTGEVLAVVSDPLSALDTALEGAYPPGSTFKVLTFTALYRHGSLVRRRPVARQP